jgi:hypothetical protein
MYISKIIELEKASKAKRFLYDYSVNEEDILAILKQLTNSDRPLTIQKCFWVIFAFCKEQKAGIRTHQKLLALTNHNATFQRNIVRIWQHCSLPDVLHTEIINQCFVFLNKPSSPIAIKAFSIATLTKLACIYPELSSEVGFIVQNVLELQSHDPGIASSAKRSLKSLKELKTKPTNQA